MINKFNKGDIVYSISVYNSLVININKMIVSSYHISNDEYVYHCVGLENEVIRDYELPNSKECNPGRTVSSHSSDSGLYFKSELEKETKKSLENRIIQNKKESDEVELFRCPLTGGKLTKRKTGFDRGGPTAYSVEGSDIAWEIYSRDWKYGVFHSTYDGIDRNFEYKGGGKWIELIKIDSSTHKCIYVDKVLYESKDVETVKEVESFLEEQKIENEKLILEKIRREKIKSNPIKDSIDSIKFPTVKRIFSTLTANECVTVSLMSTPIGLLNYFEIITDKVKIEIVGEGIYEIELSTFRYWDLEIIDGYLMFGSSKIKMVA